jgi:hypothetical protein
MLKQIQSEINLSASYLTAPEENTLLVGDSVSMPLGHWSARVKVFYKGKLVNVVNYHNIPTAVHYIQSSFSLRGDNNKTYQIIPQWDNYDWNYRNDDF